MSEPQATPAPEAPPSYQGEHVSVEIAREGERVVMRFGSGTLVMPAKAAHEIARLLEQAALAAEPPSSGAAIAAIAVAGANRGTS